MEEEDWKKWLYRGVPVVVVVAVGAALYYGYSHRQAQPQVEQPAIAQPETPPPAETPAIQNPIAAAPSSKPLPPLADSDPSMLESLSGVFGRALDPFLVPKNIVRHTVVTIDNLPRKKTSVQMWPIKALGGELVTSDNGEEVTLAEGNFARYKPVITIVQNTDTAQLAALYKEYYPLFQQSYADLGYPDGYFNDRLVEVIDHLLATPELTAPVRLKRPSVNYEFVDPELENLSAGQKLLIRMGKENAAVVKAKLREFRQAIAKQEPAR